MFTLTNMVRLAEWKHRDVEIKNDTVFDSETLLEIYFPDALNCDIYHFYGSVVIYLTSLLQVGI